MPEELGKIEKPAAESFKTGRKLFFVPLIFSNQDLPQEFKDICSRYWQQVQSQLSGLEARLGKVDHIFHELVAEGGETGLKSLEQLKVDSLGIVRSYIEKGSVLEATEDEEIITELMDWSRCLAIGMQSPKVYSTIYSSYNEASNKRNEALAKTIDGTLKPDQAAILIMGEGHHVRFPEDIHLFYVSPPALDELKRWLRDYEEKCKKEAEQKAAAEAPQSAPGGTASG